MNSTLLKHLAVITSMAVLLAACGSSPRNNHYVLTSEVGQPPTGDTPSLGIGPIHIPEYLNRNALVFSEKGNQLEVSSTQKWAEPLESGIQRVMAINLAVSLDTQNIRYFPWEPKRTPDYGVSISVLKLDANDDRATLAAEWRLYQPDSRETVARRITSLHLPLPDGPLLPEQIAPAYSELLGQLSQQISQAITTDLANP